MEGKRVFKCLSILAAVCLSTLLWASGGNAAAKTQLRLSTMFPQTHLHTTLNQMFADEIKKRKIGRAHV